MTENEISSETEIARDKIDVIDKVVSYIHETYIPDGAGLSFETMKEVLEDRSCVFHRVKIVFDADVLQEGEFAYMHRLDQDPNKGFVLYMNSFFKTREEELPYLIAYHLPVVNFPGEANSEMSELFGAKLFSMTVDEYYEKVCSLHDAMVEAKK